MGEESGPVWLDRPGYRIDFAKKSKASSKIFLPEAFCMKSRKELVAKDEKKGGQKELFFEDTFI